MGVDETARHGVKRPRARGEAREERVLASLLAGHSLEEICAEVPIGRSTLWRLRQSAEFQQRLQDARQTAFDAAVNRLHDSAVLFINTLRQVCEDPESRDSARATAARSGLDSFFNARQFIELEERLQKIEQLLGEVRK